MNAAVKIMMFSIFINLAVGLLQTALPMFKDVDVYRGGLSYNESVMRDFTSEANSTLAPITAEDDSNWLDNLLDKVGLGIVKKIKNFMDRYMYGFVNIIGSVLNLDNAILFFIKTLITIGYVLGFWYLLTNKDLGK